MVGATRIELATSRPPGVRATTAPSPDIAPNRPKAIQRRTLEAEGRYPLILSRHANLVRHKRQNPPPSSKQNRIPSIIHNQPHLKLAN